MNLAAILLLVLALVLAPSSSAAAFGRYPASQPHTSATFRSVPLDISASRSSQPGDLVVTLRGPSDPQPFQPLGFSSEVAGGSPPYTFRWSWGDNSSDDTTPSASHRYATGTFLVTLVVTDQAGASVQVRYWISLMASLVLHTDQFGDMALPDNTLAFEPFQLVDGLGRNVLAPYDDRIRAGNPRLNVTRLWWDDARLFRVLRSSSSRQSPGQYAWDWSSFDRGIEEIFSWGASVMFNAAGIPPALRVNRATYAPPNSWDDLYWFHYSFARHLVELGHPGQLVEIGNRSDAGWKGDVYQLATLWEVVASAWRAADPSVRIGGPGGLDRLDGAQAGSFFAEPVRYVESLGIPVDFYSHRISFGNPATGRFNGYRRSRIESFDDLVDRSELPMDRPLYVTGPTTEENPTQRLDGVATAAYLVATYINSADRSGVAGQYRARGLPVRSASVQAVAPWRLGETATAGGTVSLDGPLRPTFHAFELLGKLHGTPLKPPMWSGENYLYTAPGARGMELHRVSILPMRTPEGGVQLLLVTYHPVDGAGRGDYVEHPSLPISIRLFGLGADADLLALNGWLIDATHSNPSFDPAQQTLSNLRQAEFPALRPGADSGGEFIDMDLTIGPNSVLLLELALR